MFDEMGDLERALEWLRPLILGSSTWDYCVLWKLGDDPSRFIEWLGCCCNGGGNQQIRTKMMKREQNVSIPLCRDAICIHPEKTKACEALSRLPTFLSLYSEIHGEVVISGQPRWRNIAKTLDSHSSNEDSIGTQVLIPVVGGLVELFSAKLIPEDERMIEFVKAQFNSYPEVETMSTSTISFDGQSINHFLDKSTNSCISSLNQPELLRWPQPLTQIAPHYSHANFDGSSTGSFASDEHTSPDSNPCSVSQSIPLNLHSSCRKDQVDARGTPESGQKLGREPCKSKNLFTERKRRNKIKDGLFTLRSLVPNITKMDRAAILGDAIDYILELQNQIKEFEEELKDIENEDYNKNAAELKVSQSDGRIGERPKLEVQVEVNQIATGYFLLSINCQQNPGVFTKMLVALGSLGLHMNDVKDANVTTCDGKIWIKLTLQTSREEIQEEDLRDSLTRATA